MRTKKNKRREIRARVEAQRAELARRLKGVRFKGLRPGSRTPSRQTWDEFFRMFASLDAWETIADISVGEFLNPPPYTSYRPLIQSGKYVLVSERPMDDWVFYFTMVLP